MFITPKTRILRKTGTPVDCNPVLPVMYNVKGGWVALTPKPAAAIPPQTLEPLVLPTWKYVDAEHLAENGLYTTDDLTRLREHIMFPIEQPSLINNFARAAAGYRVPVKGISLTNLLDEDALNLITQSAAEKLFGGFMKFGTFTAGLLGIWMVVKVIKLVADTVIHGYALHSAYGWSIHLLGAVFSSITSLLLHLGRKTKEANRTDSSTDPISPDTNYTAIQIPAPSNFETPTLHLNPSTSVASFHGHSTTLNTLYPNLQTTVAAVSRSLNDIEERLGACLQPLDDKRGDSPQ